MANYQLPSGGFLSGGSSHDVMSSDGAFVPAPSVGGTIHTITVPLGSLAIAGLAPVVISALLISPPAGALTLTGFAPTVQVLHTVRIDVPVGSLVASGFAPTLSRSKQIDVPAGSLHVIPYAPNVQGVATTFVAQLPQTDDLWCALVQFDRVTEVAGSPVVKTTFASDVGYYDSASGTTYPPDVLSMPDYSRSLSGERLGSYTSTFGTVQYSNSDGEYDYLLDAALDGSEVRVYYGKVSWDFADFRHIFTAMGVRANGPSSDRVEVEIKDASLLLNQSIGGATLVGGTGPNADKARPVNFGFVHQAEFLALDTVARTYVHSDTGANTSAQVVRDRGAMVVYTENGDGTVTLAEDPDGSITGDVVGLASSDPTSLKTSDAMSAMVAQRCGLLAKGYYFGPHYTFQVADAEDYPLGFSLQDQRNVPDFLNDLVDSGNCFWAVNRANQFVFGRLRPNSMDALGDPVAEIVEDDVDVGSIKVDHAEPKYYRLQAYMDKNWATADNLALSLSPDEVSLLSRNGLYAVQDASVGDTYADAPEKYHLSLQLAPAVETWLSGTQDDSDLATLVAWMEVRRFMYLPWIETVQVTVPMEFYFLELGDVVKLTLSRYGLDDGALFQVVGVNVQMTNAKVVLSLMRRRTSTDIPLGWTRETAEDDTIETTPLITDFAVPPVVTPPVAPPPGPTNNPSYPPNVITSWWNPPLWQAVTANPYVDRLQFTHASYVTQVPVQTFGGGYLHNIAMTYDASYMVVGVSTDLTGTSDTDGIPSGIVRVLKRQSDGTYLEVATIDRPSSDATTGTSTWGTVVDINDELDIFVGATSIGWSSGTGAFSSDNARIYTYTGSDTWDGGTDLGFSFCFWAHFSKWNAAGSWPSKRVLVVQEGWIGTASVPSTSQIHVWTNSGSSWVDTQTLSLASIEPTNITGAQDAAISFDGRNIAVLYNALNSSGRSGAYFQLWQSNDNVTWNIAVPFSVQIDTTGALDGGPVDMGQDACIAMSADARVIAITNGNFGTNVGGTYRSALYIYRAQGTAIWPVVGTYDLKATLYGADTTSNPSFAGLAMTLDGQFIAVSENEATVGGTTEVGRMYGINRVQSISGKSSISLYTNQYEFSNPYAGQVDAKFGSGVAMDINGRRVVSGVQPTIAGTGTVVTVFENRLDDLIAGITNDDFDGAIDITPGIDVVDGLLSATKPKAAGAQRGETVSTTGSGLPVTSLWYKLAPLVDVIFSIDDLLSTTPLDPFFPASYPSSPNIDTALVLFTGSSVDALTEVAGNDDSPAGGTLLSNLSNVRLTSGTTYYVRVQPYTVGNGVDYPLLKLRYSYKTVNFFIKDTFTGTTGTSLIGTGAHVGEIGASWTLNPDFGPGVDDEFQIYNNALRRKVVETTFFDDTYTGIGNLSAHTSDSGHTYSVQVPGASTLVGGYLVVSAGTSDRDTVATNVTPTIHVYVAEIYFDLSSGAWESQLALWTEYTGTVGTNKLITTITALAGGGVQFQLNDQQSGTTPINVTTSAGDGPHTLRLFVTNGAQAMSFDGTRIGSASLSMASYTGRQIAYTTSADNTSGTNASKLKTDRLHIYDTNGGSDGGGEALIYASGTVGTATQYYADTYFSLDALLALGSGAFVALYEKCDTGSRAIVYWIGLNMLDASNNTAGISVGGPNVATFSFVDGRTYMSRLTVNGTNLSVTVYDTTTNVAVTTTSWTRASVPADQLGLDIFDADSLGLVQVDKFEVWN